MTPPGGSSFALCCNCGLISPCSEWRYLQRDSETGELRPSRDDEMDPIAVCARCGYEHRDGDDGPGLYEGMFVEMCQEKGQEAARSPAVAEAWEAEQAEMGQDDRGEA